MTGLWEISYILHVDGKQTEVELVGSSKKDAYEMLADQWWYTYHEEPPDKQRCKLVEIDRVRWGNP